MRAEDGTRERLVVLVLSVFGLGLVPLAPGTVASLAAAALIGAFGPPLHALIVALVCLAFGVWATLRFAGRIDQERDHGDPGWVVSDEVAGQALACMCVLPFGTGWVPAAAAFAGFRLFDILKPGPVGRLEKIPGPAGVLLDDLGAGALGGLVGATVVLCFPGLL